MSTNNLYAAHNQWKSRPDDERFDNPEEMLTTARYYRERATVSDVIPLSSLKVLHTDTGDLQITRGGAASFLTNYSFGQFCRSLSAPAEFISELPAPLAAQVLNDRVQANSGDKATRILFHNNGRRLARAITSDMYDRVWNADLIERGILPMIRQHGWRVPPARPVRSGQAGTRKATAADILPNQGAFGLSVKEGDDIAPAGLYASDHDMFAFLVDPNRGVRVGDRYLMRGVFFRNSEVGDGSLVGTFVLLDNVCGNHICWGVENVHEIRLRHVAARAKVNQGETLKRFVKQWEVECRKYENAGAAETEQKIAKAMKLELGTTKEEIIEAVFKYARGHSLPLLTKTRLEEAYNTAEKHQDWYGNNPRTVYSLVAGLTENSQKTGFTDSRTDLDIQAGALLDMAF